MVSSVQETIASNRIVFVEKEDYTIDLEYNEEFLIVHLPRLIRFNKSVLVGMKSDIDRFSHFFKTSGYRHLFAAVDTNNTKIKRLLVRLGFVRVGIHEDDDVYRKEL